MIHYLRPRIFIFLHDSLMVPLAWLGAYWFRFNLSDVPLYYGYYAIAILPLVMLVQLLVYLGFSVYRGVWRFYSLPDFIRVLKAVLSGILIISVLLFFINRLHGVPRTVLPLYSLFLLILLIVPRVLYRMWKENAQFKTLRRPVLVVGAGAAGEMLVRDLLSGSDSEYVPYGFVDDDINKRKREVRGVRVLGSIEQIPELLTELAIEMVFIAIPSASDKQMRRIIEICENSQVGFMTLPSVKELMSGRISSGNLRKVEIEDVLGRDPVKLNWQAIRDSLSNKCIMVTGGGGSIGSELCIQIAALNPSQLIVFDQNEYSLYKIDQRLGIDFPQLDFQVVLGDVCNPIAVKKAINGYNPDVIFHAAAYKHVPLLEAQVMEAVMNNLIGTKIVAEQAIASEVQRFVLISTDKAVNPTNVMGATKRAAEILCQNLDNPEATRFVTVRFGNVLDSAGSVVPLFREQINAGGPVTVTDPDITRYFMTIPEACLLIMQAETVGQGGEIFVLDMGEPIKIAYLAEQMIRLSGLQPDVDIKIKYIGLRPGEKLYEELFYAQEPPLDTPYDKLFLAKARRYHESSWNNGVTQLQQACEAQDPDLILTALKKLVPEFQQRSA